jgi:NAD kinase
MSTLPPRAVVVTRETDYERLLAVHATREQTRFFLRSRGQDIDEVERQHDRFLAAVQAARRALPTDWRIAKVGRSDLDRFIFGPEDVVLAIGQDGLVANLAKYLAGQPVLGVNPAPDVNEGVLVPLAVEDVARLAPAAAAGGVDLERRTMVKAVLDDGQALTALNEIFIGHHSHQSARYVLTFSGESEHQSSSGIIVSTGTGATGWARSIMTATRRKVTLAPTDPAFVFFVREAWPSVATAATITAGRMSAGHALAVTSNINDGGVIFADGIEQDHLSFGWGRNVKVEVAKTTLNLVRAG